MLTWQVPICRKDLKEVDVCYTMESYVLLYSDGINFECNNKLHSWHHAIWHAYFT